jgi:putative phosphoribosyl transferase
MVKRPVRLSVGPVTLDGDLAIPSSPAGIVLFAHGNGSGRASGWSELVARRLQASGLATLALDLLTPAENVADLRAADLRLDVPLLARRLVATTAWLVAQPEIGALRLGYLGERTGAAAALVAAAVKRDRVSAVVSYDGRIDLTGHFVTRVEAPTLLIVGSEDASAVKLNERALYSLHAQGAMEVVPGGTDRFDAPGALETIADLACEWFTRHLGASTARARAVG